MPSARQGSSAGQKQPLASRSDAELCTVLASHAGTLLVRLRVRHAESPRLRDEGDRASHEFLVDALGTLRPDDAVLSEEGADDLARCAAERVWIVDPLDGTREFGEPDRSDWAVHVALWCRGRLVAGAVALPALGRTLSTAEPATVPPRKPGPIRMLVSRTRPPEFALSLAAKLGAELMPMGSAGAKSMAVVRGEADVYAHAGGQYEWDSAAPVAVAAAAGLHTSRVDGSPMRYNAANPYQPDLLVCRPQFATEVLGAIHDLRSGS